MQTRSTRKARTGKSRTASRSRPVSRTRQPDDLSLEQWQALLRVEFGKSQNFTLKNLGEHPVYSDFSVHNPTSGQTYRVSIRGETRGVNYCTCPDYSVNTLGICKHIAFALNHLRKRKATARLLSQPYEPDFAEVYLQYGEQRRIMFSPGAHPTPGLRRSMQTFVNPDGSVKPHGIRCLKHFLSQVRRSRRDVRCYDDVLELIAQMNDARRRERVISRKYANTTRKRIRGIRTTLYPYQYEGVLFAAKAGRCIIADEMGLGKTVQAIAAAEVMASNFGVERVLIVCPASVKYQWLSEIERFCSRTAQVIEGLAHQRRPLYQRDRFFSIAGYEQVLRDIHHVNTAAFDLIVLDETQRIKNWKTKTAQSVKQLRSPYAIALTGTPLENRVEELHSIVEFIDRYRLGPLFKFLHNHEVRDDNGRVVGYTSLRSIGTSLAPILIRRRKRDVQQQLPERVEKRHFVPMTPLQRDYHEENQVIVSRISAKWRRRHFLSEADQRRLTIALMRMRMSCNDAFLVDKQNRAGHKVPVLRDVLTDALEVPQTKVVVFSQWTTMQELVVEMLEAERIGFVYLHGGVPVRKRKELMERFRRDQETRVFLSTDAGQTGLNLQRASVIVNLDLPWNPAVLEQRIGRVHRIGQQRTVRVVNIVAEKSIEHSMIDVLAFKKSVFGGVLDGGADGVMMGGTRLGKFMKEISSVTESAQVETAPAAPTEPMPAAHAESPTDSGPNRATSQAQSTESLTQLLQLGVNALSSVLEQVSRGNGGDGNGGSGPCRSSAAAIEVDPHTGRQVLTVPLPPPETLQQAIQAAAPLLYQLLGGRGGSAG